MNKKLLNSIIFSIPLSFFLGCTLVQLKKETEIIQNSSILVGYVSAERSLSGTPIVVAAYEKNGATRKVAHYTILHEPSAYELIVPKGMYHIFAFADINRNLIYEKGEPAGQYIGVDPVFAPSGGVVKELNIKISDLADFKVDFPTGFVFPPKTIPPFHSTSPGAIADLDDKIFSDEFCEKGFWTPLEFFREVGGNIYFLDAYDPNKIPILFIHGAAGSPKNWKSFVEAIDRDKFQPWFFYYPSGAPINSMSYLLFWKLFNLHSKYKFRRLCITAHSMGGLVVRSFLLNFGNLFQSVTTNFISISTPWGGEKLAENGVKYSPSVIPAWKDMQPNGEFLKSLFRKRMPPGIGYYLFFGYKGNRNPLRPNNDKTVTLASQLDRRSQREAKMIYGFNEDHFSILSSQQVLFQYSAILAAAYPKTGNSQELFGNRLHVRFSFEFPKEVSKPRATLVLRPVDSKQSEIWLYLNPEDTDRDQGPFPSGNYEVSLVAPAFLPEPAAEWITIGKDTVPRVEFHMKPIGYIGGYIINKERRRIQAGEYLEPDLNVQVQSITLRGNGICRTITPLKEEDPNFLDLYLSGTDYATRGMFCFYGLSAGRYEVTLNAKGYEPYSEARTVYPGHYGNEMEITLTKNAVENQ